MIQRKTTKTPKGEKFDGESIVYRYKRYKPHINFVSVQKML